MTAIRSKVLLRLMAAADALSILPSLNLALAVLSWQVLSAHIPRVPGSASCALLVIDASQALAVSLSHRPASQAAVKSVIQVAILDASCN
mmetsp:Transcript_62115/g.148145  ORF Transcript_62115/g.148145 Transcript_62115/m.148145 type:complete len:90 (+) Transcript_62115:1358-1627(+)